MKKNIIFTFIIIFTLLIMNSSFSRTNKSLIKKIPPEINAKNWLNSEKLNLNDQKGKIIFLEFWATWCPPCKKSIPHLIELYKKYSKKNDVVFISLTNESYDKVKPYIEEMKINYPVGTGSSTGRDYNVTSIPHSLIIDRNGIVFWEGHPSDDIEKRIDELLKRKIKVDEPAKKEKN